MIDHLQPAIAFRAAKALPALSRSGSRGRSRLRRDRGRRPILATRSPSHRRTRVAVGAIAGGLIVPGFVGIQQKEDNCRGDHRHNYRKTSAASPCAGPQFLVSVKIGHRVHPSVGPSHVTASTRFAASLFETVMPKTPLLGVGWEVRGYRCCQRAKHVSRRSPKHLLLGRFPRIIVISEIKRSSPFAVWARGPHARAVHRRKRPRRFSIDEEINPCGVPRGRSRQ